MKPFKENLEKIKEKGLIPVVIIEDPKKAVPLGKAFLDASLDIIEITMRTQRAIEAIKVLREGLPEMLVGAGTVFSLQIAKEAIKAGARFIVSPHLDEEMAKISELTSEALRIMKEAREKTCNIRS